MNKTMNKTTKVVATIGVIFLYILIATPITAAMSEAGRSPGILGLILLAALIGAIRAIWKKADDDNKDENSSILQK